MDLVCRESSGSSLRHTNWPSRCVCVFVLFIFIRVSITNHLFGENTKKTRNSNCLHDLREMYQNVARQIGMNRISRVLQE